MPDAGRGHGLSPRGRGNHHGPRPHRHCEGSIPAWAGKPRSIAPPSSCSRVYPRVGGETLPAGNPIVGAEGLSPRGRGNRARTPAPGGGHGSIPAWAGKPTARSRRSMRRTVYPRVGGETAHSVATTSDEYGLSPRGRGNRGGRVSGRGRPRSIPAWAGKPHSCAAVIHRWRVYPRVGGETRTGCTSPEKSRGLSPRGRGNRTRHSWLPRCARSIPAWAGKPRAGDRYPISPSVYPRVGGETVLAAGGALIGGGLSPRGRGNRGCRNGGRPDRGSIPAWAGKPRPVDHPARIGGVYPRVGGETQPTPISACCGRGLSPRGRGNPGS